MPNAFLTYSCLTLRINSHSLVPVPAVIMAKGAGQGQGGGEGRGETTGEDVAVGSGVAIVFTIIMCVCGVPMIIAGAILVQIEISYVHREASYSDLSIPIPQIITTCKGCNY